MDELVLKKERETHTHTHTPEDSMSGREARDGSM